MFCMFPAVYETSLAAHWCTRELEESVFSITLFLLGTVKYSINLIWNNANRLTFLKFFL